MLQTCSVVWGLCCNRTSPLFTLGFFSPCHSEQQVSCLKQSHIVEQLVKQVLLVFPHQQQIVLGVVSPIYSVFDVVLNLEVGHWSSVPSKHNSMSHESPFS